MGNVSVAVIGVMVVVAGGLGGCASWPMAAPSPLPVLGELSRVERGRMIQARTRGLRTLHAVLAVAYSAGPRQGTFDLVVNYVAPENMRFTALKDTLLSVQVLFDVLFTRKTYHLMARDETGEQRHQGDVTDFVTEYPTFRTFFLVGEAFFLPGADGTGQMPRFNATGTRFTTRLTNGAEAVWFARKDTLEVTNARLVWSTAEGKIPVRLQYQDYRQVAGYWIPHRVTLRDRQVGFTAQAVVKQVEINVPITPDTFEMSAIR